MGNRNEKKVFEKWRVEKGEWETVTWDIGIRNVGIIGMGNGKLHWNGNGTLD